MSTEEPIAYTLSGLLYDPTDSQREYYEKRLYPLQDLVLSKTPALDGLVLSGGTALSRFLFRHRYSDDLDFYFYGQDSLSSHKTFETNIRQFRQKLVHAGLDVSVQEESDHFLQWLIKSPNVEHPLKVELIFELRSSLGSYENHGPFFRDSLENLAINKVSTLIGRNLVRDVLDLQAISSRLSVQKILDLSEGAYGPLYKEDLLLMTKNVVTPRNTPVFLTGQKDVLNLLRFMDTLEREIRSRIEREGEILKKKLPAVLSDLFWDDSSTGRMATKISNIDEITPEQATRILEYGSLALWGALGTSTLQRIKSLPKWPLRLSPNRKILLDVLSE